MPLRPLANRTSNGDTNHRLPPSPATLKQRRHSISTSTLLMTPAITATMSDRSRMPLARTPLRPPTSTRASMLPMPVPANSSAPSPTARKIAAERRRHSFRASATSASTVPPSTPSHALSPVKVLSSATAALRIHNSSTKKPAAATTSLSTSTPHELPILRFHYIARNVRVCVAPSWKLQRFEVKSIRLQTGAEPLLCVFSTGEGVKFMLPTDTTCELTSGNGIKLKSRVDGAIRVRIRFSTAADAAIWSRLIADTLGHAAWLRDFEEVQCLSQDHKSRVMVARHTTQPHQECVVKVLKDVRADAAACDEIHILKKLVSLAHPNTPLAFLRGYRVVESQQDVHIVMPRHAGKTMLAFLSDRAARPHVLAEHEARRVVEQVCEVLHVLHANDVIHCDLKLENILLTADAKEAHLIDFGGAYDGARANDQQPTRRMVGTPGYIAPERILRVDEPPAPASDLFSLGIVLYQVLVGEHPFAKAQATRRRLAIDDSLALDRMHMQRRLRQRNVSPEAQLLVEQLVAADPRQRLTLDQVFDHVWFSNQLSC